MVIKNGTPGPDTLLGSLDADTLRGQGGDDLLQPLSGLDFAYGGAGNDIIAFVDLSGGQAFGGTGDDTLDLTLGAGPSLFLDFQDGTVTQGGTLTFTGMNRLVLTSQGDGDTVYGSASNDIITYGGRGGEIHARGGDDTVAYSPSLAATLDGGTGNDTLVVDAGDNVLYFIVDTFANRVDDGQLSRIIGFETYRATGGTFNDIAAVDEGNDLFQGLGGNDTGLGNLGDDTLRGDDGADSLMGADGNDLLQGGTEQDTLIGGLGADTLIGNAGSDVIDGGDGRDRIVLNLGNDTVTGGAGADKFVFNGNQTGYHVFTDFVSGQDQLLFNPVLLQFGPGSGPLDPDLLSIGAASGPQAQFVLTYTSGTNISTLLWDPNGDNPAGGAYALIRFTGEITLTAGDIFIL